MPYGDKKSYSFFKMKGHTLPGIKQKSGGNKSSALQQKMTFDKKKKN